MAMYNLIATLIVTIHELATVRICYQVASYSKTTTILKVGTITIM